MTEGLEISERTFARRVIEMIGIWGFLEELSFPAFSIVFLLLVAFAAGKTPRRSSGFSQKGTIALLVLVLLPVVTSWQFAREIQARHFLTSLRTEEVDWFSIGAQKVADESKKSVLVKALREIQWFSPHHDGWAQPVDFRVKLRSGEERYFQIATYLREPGVAIDFAAAPKGRVGLHAGYAFSRTLLSTLADMGIALPH